MDALFDSINVRELLSAQDLSDPTTPLSARDLRLLIQRLDSDSLQIKSKIQSYLLSPPGFRQPFLRLQRRRFALQPNIRRRGPASKFKFQPPHRGGDWADYEADERHKQEEEEKEQCSPISVLDPPFQDDYEGRDGDGEDDDDEDGCDLECSYANVQRTKHHLLQKLRRFEQLAGLNPIELNKRMLEEDDDDDEC
ncbi:hypothetical protein EV1_034279 [Malus domestica]